MGVRIVTRDEWALRSSRSSRWLWRPTRLGIYARDRFDCVYCRGVFPPWPHTTLTVDHVHCRVEGAQVDASGKPKLGKRVTENLVTACAECNYAKQDKTLDDWLAELHARGFVRRRVKQRIDNALATPVDRKLGAELAGLFRRVEEGLAPLEVLYQWCA